MLAAIPIAEDDPWYAVAVNTALTIGGSDRTLLENDWDPQGASLSASVVGQPAHGALSNFNAGTGTFTYTPDTDFAGFDSFTYEVTNGESVSNTATVSIAVGGHFGPRTNQEESPGADLLLSGANLLAAPLTPGVDLIYNSATHPRPLIAVETFLQPGSSVPDEILATLTFDGVSGTTYSYSTSGLDAGDPLRFVLQADATSLPSGHYDYTLELTARFDTTYVDHEYEGQVSVVNRHDDEHPFGRGWQLAGLDELVIEASGVLWVQSTGAAHWFAWDGSSAYLPAIGDQTFSTLIENQDGSFALTDKHGYTARFDSSGRLTAREDRSGNIVAYAYTSGLLTKITDPFDRETVFAYSGGQLESVTDFADRTATLDYDLDGRLVEIIEPDPDGVGALPSPEWSFTYASGTHQLTSVTNPLSETTSFSYGTHQRLTELTHPNQSDSWEIIPLQTIGLPTGTSGNSLTPANPEGVYTDERGKASSFRTDRFGNLTEWNNPLGHETELIRNQHGQLAKLIEADPGAGGPLTSPVTILGYVMRPITNTTLEDGSFAS